MFGLAIPLCRLFMQCKTQLILRPQYGISSHEQAASVSSRFQYFCLTLSTDCIITYNCSCSSLHQLNIYLRMGLTNHPALLNLAGDNFSRPGSL